MDFQSIALPPELRHQLFGIAKIGKFPFDANFFGKIILFRTAVFQLKIVFANFVSHDRDNLHTSHSAAPPRVGAGILCARWLSGPAWREGHGEFRREDVHGSG